MEEAISRCRRPRKNMFCVLRRGVLILVVSAAGLHTAVFAMVIATETKALRAARAAAVEATLPRATRDSVTAIAISQLARSGIVAGGDLVYVEQNGYPAKRHFRATPSDDFAVSITIRLSDVLPAPLSGWNRLFGRPVIRAQSSRSVGDSAAADE